MMAGALMTRSCGRPRSPEKTLCTTCLAVKLRTGAINGMLGQLDPYTVYVPPADEEKFDRLLESFILGAVRDRPTAPPR